ncbi:MAG TPA: hypothetical protein VG711_02245 [Phycisphaerales bacterium]|nr:hypothetical protein [Phycisphaerales bacterium]
MRSVLVISVHQIKAYRTKVVHVLDHRTNPIRSADRDEGLAQTGTLFGAGKFEAIQ